MRRARELILDFPIHGIDERAGYMRQPHRERNTCVYAVNVRSRDPVTGRLRGGQRPGMKKYCPDQINSTNEIQDLVYVVSVTGGSGSQSELAVRTTKALAVAAGKVFTFDSTGVSSPTDNATYTLSANAPVVFSTQHFGDVYFCDGASYVYYDTSADAMKQWTASAGSMPANGADTARLIASWRGRIVLAGIASDPHNWFMSAVGTADDFDYSPTTQTELQAVSGNQDGAGKVGDAITALVPYSDDLLIIGCDHSVWQMSGDPMAGGRLDRIATVGMAWGRAWCIGPSHEIYFWGTQGRVYRLVPGAGLEWISAPVDDRFQAVNLNTNLVRMEYSPEEWGVRIWITPIDGDNYAECYFYDIETGAWWVDLYGSADLYARAVIVFDGDDPEDRRLLIGCKDGYVRTVERDATSDDGTALESTVVLGPVRARGKLAEMIVSEVQATMAPGSAATLRVLTDDAEEDVLVPTGVAELAGLLTSKGEILYASAGTQRKVEWTVNMNGSRSYVGFPRLRGKTCYITIEDSQTNGRWALDFMRVKLTEISSSRSRRMN